MEVRIGSSVEEAAALAGQWLAGRLREVVDERGAAALALSGGSTAPALLAGLLDEDVPWSSVTVWQVDERVADDGDPERNANALAVLPAEATIRLMPVTDADLDVAAREYADGLPAALDIVHLGVGEDGHTASWPPGDPVAASSLAVDVSGEYQGRRRMTLTPRVVNAAACRLVYVVGSSKAVVVAAWLGGDVSRPIGLVERTDTVVVLDRAAASALPR